MSDKSCLRDGAILKKVKIDYPAFVFTINTEPVKYDAYECPHCGELTFFRRD